MLVYEKTPGKEKYLSTYEYVGFDELTGTHVFRNSVNGKEEIFVRRCDPPASWHLILGASAFEFVSGR